MLILLRAEGITNWLSMAKKSVTKAWGAKFVRVVTRTTMLKIVISEV